MNHPKIYIILANLIGSQHKLTEFTLNAFFNFCFFASGDPLIDGSDKQTEKVANVFFFHLPITHLKSLSAGVNICVILCHSLPCVTLWMWLINQRCKNHSNLNVNHNWTLCADLEKSFNTSCETVRCDVALNKTKSFVNILNRVKAYFL